MEYRLNKIDPELRQRIFQQTSSGKIHSKNKLAINKDKNQEKNSGEGNFSEELRKKEQGKQVYVQAIKLENIEVSATKEKSLKDNTRGLVIDTKK